MLIIEKWSEKKKMGKDREKKGRKEVGVEMTVDYVRRKCYVDSKE